MEEKWRNKVYFVQSKSSLKIRWISWCLQCCEKHRCCEKKVQNMKPSTNNEKHWWWTCLLRKKHKNRNRKNTTLFVDFAENQRNWLFEASDWLLAEAPRLFLSGSLAHPRRLPQVPRSFFLRSWFFFVLYPFWPAVVFLFFVRSLFWMLVSFHRFFIQMKWVHTSMQFV